MLCPAIGDPLWARATVQVKPASENEAIRAAERETNQEHRMAKTIREWLNARPNWQISDRRPLTNASSPGFVQDLYLARVCACRKAAIQAGGLSTCGHFLGDSPDKSSTRKTRLDR
jgi:hypothetical protein